MRTLFFVFVISLLFPLASSAQTCSHDTVQRAAENTKSIRARMLAVKGNKDGLNYDVAPATSALISAMKGALATTVDEFMHCASGNTVDAKKIETSLANSLEANKPQPLAEPVTESTVEPTTNIYGDDLQIVVTRPDENLPVIAVQTSFVVGCGVDTMLLIYESKNGTWEQKLRWQSGDYKDISGAFGDFFKFVVLPHKESEQWVVAAAHGMPWCSSRWSGYDLDLIQPTQNSSPQRVLVHKNAEYVRFEIEPTMNVVPSGFELRLETGQIDLDVMTRIGVYRYLVDGDKLQRVQPVATNGRDFVDEWLQSNWSDAAHWTAPTDITSLQDLHASITELRDPKAKNFPDLTYGPVLACADNPKHFQVEFDQDEDPLFYFQIEEGENSFTMLGAPRSPDPRCKGVDVLQKQ